MVMALIHLLILFHHRWLYEMSFVFSQWPWSELISVHLLIVVRHCHYLVRLISTFPTTVVFSLVLCSLIWPECFFLVFHYFFAQFDIKLVF